MEGIEYMRIVLVLTLFLLPAFSWSVNSENVLDKVVIALKEEQWENAVRLFAEAVKEDADKAEMFYWTRVDKECQSVKGMLEKLAIYHYKQQNYDKAFLFYKELTRIYPQELSYLIARAEIEFYRGKAEVALRTYEQILKVAPENIQANTYVGNYYFLEAENSQEGIEKDYKRILVPTRMEYAAYRNKMREVYVNGYVKAKAFLQNAMRYASSQGIKSTLDRIEKVREKVEE